VSLQSDASIGFKKETTFGVPVTPDRHLEFLDESLDWKPTFVQGAGQRPGKRVARSSKRVLTKEEIGGSVNIELPTRGIGTWLEALFGQGASTLVPATTAVYQQVFTLVKNDFLPSLTIQKAVPKIGGDLEVLNMLGCVASNFEIAMGNADILKLNSEWVGKAVDRDLAYATPTYPTSHLFSFTGAQLVVGGTVVKPTSTALATGGDEVLNIRDFSIKVDNGLDGDGFNIGGRGQRTRKPAMANLAAITGSLTAEFDDEFYIGALLEQDDLALLATFESSGPLIETGQPFVVQVLVPCIRFESELPKATNGVKTQALSFTGLDDLTGEPIYVVVRTADTAL
jgi:hypothetical protein